MGRFAKFTVQDLYAGVFLDYAETGPKTLVLVCSHGNEICGLKAVMALQDSGELDSVLEQGSLQIILGNPLAYEAGQRALNYDLNRSIGKKDLEFSYERKRAKLIEEAIESSDLTLDLHSTSMPSASHALPCETPQAENLASSFPVKYLVTKMAHLTVEGGTSLDWAKKKSRAAIAIECGQHSEESAVQTAMNCIRHLTHLSHPSTQEPTKLECTQAIEVCSNFQFTRKVSGFDFFEYRAQVGKDDSGLITCPYKDGAYLIMPNSDPKPGEEAFYWAT
jgi:succinylglutamate desuccinylase